MKIAIVHDWLTGMRGGERCLEVFLALYPNADLYTLIHVPGATSKLIDDRLTGTSILQRLPGVKKYYRFLLPFFPLAARSLDLSQYDYVISLSHAAAKNVRVRRDAVHICYCFTPMRYIWDQAGRYWGRATTLLMPMIKLLQKWDRGGASGVTNFVAISTLVAARIRSFYSRDSDIVHPPIADFWFEQSLPCGRGEAFLYAGALVPYKRIELVIEACIRAGERIWIAGEGPLERKLRDAYGARVQFFGRVTDHELRDLYRSSRALLFGAKEDFGLIPVECQAVGRPVIALYEGGARETVRGIVNWGGEPRVIGGGKSAQNLPEECRDKCSASGVFAQPGRDDSEELRHFTAAIRAFIETESSISSASCRMQARSFSRAAFLESWITFLRKYNYQQLIPDVQTNAQRETAAI